MSDQGLVALPTTMPPALLRYWTAGAGGAKIRWNVRGDFRRCRRQLGKYVTPGRKLNGLCANLHKIATGRWPNERGATVAEEDCVGCGEGEPMTDEDVSDMVAAMVADTENVPQDVRDALVEWQNGMDGSHHDVGQDESGLLAAVPAARGLPLADRDREWDSDAAVARVKEWAGGDEFDADRFERAFFYRDPDVPADQVGAYSLPFADVIGGELTAVPRGVFAAANALQGGRGARLEQVSESDRETIRARIGDYYERLDSDPPWAMNAEREVSDPHSGAMIALVPSQEDAERIAIEVGVPADELHVTLLFLGDAEQWSEEQRDSLRDVVATIANGNPVEANMWAALAINPGTDAETIAYSVGDDDGLAGWHNTVVGIEGAHPDVPEQHSPWIPHMSVAYLGDEVNDENLISAEGHRVLGVMDQFGPVTLDRLRVSFAGEVTDYPLTGETVVEPTEEESAEDEVADSPVSIPEMIEDALTAAVAVWPMGSQLPTWTERDRPIVAEAAQNAPVNPPGDWFKPIVQDGPTPPTVTRDGRFFGLVAQEGKCYANNRERCVPVPDTETNYGAWYTGEVITAEGDTVPVGYLYGNCGHSSTKGTLEEARDHLNTACTKLAAVRVYDSDYGPMAVGQVMPGLTAERVEQLARVSGEWFPAPLELHAAVAVPRSAFPVDGSEQGRVRVAEEEPVLAAEDWDLPAMVGDITDSVIAELKRREEHNQAQETVVSAARRKAQREIDRYVRKGM